MIPQTPKSTFSRFSGLFLRPYCRHSNWFPGGLVIPGSEIAHRSILINEPRNCPRIIENLGNPGQNADLGYRGLGGQFYCKYYEKNIQKAA